MASTRRTRKKVRGVVPLRSVRWKETDHKVRLTCTITHSRAKQHDDFGAALCSQGTKHRTKRFLLEYGWRRPGGGQRPPGRVLPRGSLWKGARKETGGIVGVSVLSAVRFQPQKRQETIARAKTEGCCRKPSPPGWVLPRGHLRVGERKESPYRPLLVSVTVRFFRSKFLTLVRRGRARTPS